MRLHPLSLNLAVKDFRVWRALALIALSLAVGAGAQAQSFALTGGLNTGRGTHTATLLNNGMVLVTGGFDNANNTLASAELYDPSTGTFSVTGSMNSPRVFHAAALLNTGKVLIVGGQDSSGTVLSGAELYDPAAGTFTATGNLNVARQVATLTPLNNGKVLVAGGDDSNWNAQSSAELYDPKTGTFTATGSLATARATHTATLLNNGKVLVAGGGGQDSSGNFQVLGSAELYDPATGTFASAGNANATRLQHTATLLNNGQVLLAGGIDNGNNTLASAELYDPVAGTFAATGSLNSGRWDFTATLLTNGTVLLVGGYDSNVNAESSAELYDPATGTFASTGNLNVGRDTQTATRLNSGVVLVSGGYDTNWYSLASTELYQPATLVPAGLVSIAVSPANPSLLVGATQPFIATGTFSDNSTQFLASANWSSSDNTIATITNDASDPGQACAVSVGSTTISACTSSICGSATVTITPPPNITGISPASGPVGTIVTVSGTNFGATQGSSTVTFNGLPATAATWSNTQILLSVPSALSLGTAQVTLTTSVGPSNSATFTVLLPAPTINLTSATTAIPGQAVTIFGRGFGATQGGGTVQLGSTTAAALSWTDFQIVATVAPSAQSGVAQVFQGGLASNQIALTIVAPDTLTASASPAANSNGWNNSNVTVTFTCTSAGQAIPNCVSPQTVATEGVGQVVSGTATGSGGTPLTASVTLNIDKTIPALAITTPADGASFTASSATVSGTVSDALSGLSSVTCNGVATTVSGGAFSCNISLNVGVNLVVVRATDVAGNVAASNYHLSLAGTLPAPYSLQITPSTVNMLVGGTQTFTVVDELGRPRTDATWTISDTTLATITTDSSPVLTAVAVGQPTLTANVQGLSAQIQVNILVGTSFTPGTVIWSAPSSSGINCEKIIQAVPTTSGTPDLYCVGGGLVLAFTSDGRQMWQYSPTAGSVLGTKAIPDGFGGLLVAIGNQYTSGMFDLDGQTGQPKWQTSTLSQDDSMAIGQDGTVYGKCASCSDPALVGIDGQSGSTRVCVLLPQPSSAQAEPLAVDVDGSVIFEHQIDLFSGDHTQLDSTIFLFRVRPDGTASSQPLETYHTTMICPPSGGWGCGIAQASPGRIIPDGQGGQVVLWYSPLAQGTAGAHVTSSAISQYELPVIGVQDDGIVLGENGTAFVTGSLPSYSGGTTLSYNIDSGQVAWGYQVPSQNTFRLITAADGNGLVAKTTDPNGVDTAARFDVTGTATPDTWTGANIQYELGDQFIGQDLQTYALSAFSAQAVPGSNSVFPDPNRKGTERAKQKIKLQVMSVTEAEVSLGYIQDKLNTAIGYWQLNAGILLDWDGRTVIPVPACSTTPPPNNPNWTCSPTNFDSDPNNISDPADVTWPEIKRRFNPTPEKGVQILFLDNFLYGTTGSVHGYAPKMLSNSSGTHNLLMYRNNSDKILGVAHEIGHVFGLDHTAGVSNLMCSHDSIISPVVQLFFPCVSADANQLTKRQISDALKTASTLAE